MRKRKAVGMAGGQSAQGRGPGDAVRRARSGRTLRPTLGAWLDSKSNGQPLKGFKQGWACSGLRFQIRKNKIMPSAATGMDLDIIVLSELSQTEKDKYVVSCICGI